MDPIATSSHPTGNFTHSGPAQSPTVSVGNWLITYLVSFVPVVGFIMLLVWAFSSSTPPSKANWAKAALVAMSIFTVLSILFAGTLFALLVNTYANYHYSR